MVNKHDAGTRRPIIRALNSTFNVAGDYKRRSLPASCPQRIYIQRARIHPLRGLLFVLNRLEMNYRHRTKKLHGRWFSQTAVVKIPTCTFQEEATTIRSVFCMLCYRGCRCVYDRELPTQRIYCDTILSCGSLQQRSQEPRWICEAGQPKASRKSFINPFYEGIYPRYLDSLNKNH